MKMLFSKSVLTIIRYIFIILIVNLIIIKNSYAEDTTESYGGFGTMSLGCCGWTENFLGDMYNVNPTEWIGIGLEFPQVQFHVQQDIRANGSIHALGFLSSGGNINSGGLIRAEGLLTSGDYIQSDKLARQDGGVRLAAINEQGEIIELPLPPSMINWYNNLFNEDFFDHNNYNIGTLDPIPIDFFDPSIFNIQPYAGMTVIDCSNGPFWYTRYDNNADKYYKVIICNPMVGIGTIKPERMLHVAGSSLFEGALRIFRPNSEAYSYGLDVHVGHESAKSIVVTHNENENFIVWGNGVVGARAVKITSGTHTSNFPDYVFAPDYKLMSIREFSEYINKNKSLPHLPTAKEVKDAGYIDLADLQLRTVRSLEEQSLYIISIKDENDALKEQLDAANKRLEAFEKRLEQLENSK